MTKPAKFSPRYYLRPRNMFCNSIDSVIGGDIHPPDIENHNSQEPSLERVCRVSRCFHHCPGLTIVQKYTAHQSKDLTFASMLMSPKKIFLSSSSRDSLQVLSFTLHPLQYLATFPTAYISEFFCFFFIHNEIP